VLLAAALLVPGIATALRQPWDGPRGAAFLTHRPGASAAGGVAPVLGAAVGRGGGRAGGAGAGGGGGGGPGHRITVPSGFRPIARYRRLVKSFRFAGPRLPSGWSAGIWNYGFAATQFQPSRVRMTGSAAELTAKPGGASQGLRYQSGWISTEGAFTVTHGTIDFRVALPHGQGLWAGVWMVNSAGVEIDDAEVLLGKPHVVYGSLHTHSWWETQSRRSHVDLATGYHDFQVVWQPGLITWALDGRAYAQFSRAQALASGRPWPFDDSGGVYLIADLAIAGRNEWGGPLAPATRVPSSMLVRSVTVWQ
jgi:hypothetical protein